MGNKCGHCRLLCQGCAELTHEVEACGDEEDSKLQPDDPPVQRAIGYLAIRGASRCTGNQQGSEHRLFDGLQESRHHFHNAVVRDWMLSSLSFLMAETPASNRRVLPWVNKVDWRSELACKGRLRALPW